MGQRVGQRVGWWVQEGLVVGCLLGLREVGLREVGLREVGLAVGLLVGDTGSVRLGAEVVGRRVGWRVDQSVGQSVGQLVGQ